MNRTSQTLSDMEMKERPILFSGPMIRAVMQGRKTQTRRIVKFPVKDPSCGCEVAGCELNSVMRDASEICPYGKPRDRLWVRETWQQDDSNPSFTYYKADGKHCSKWRPSIFMPRNRSRITLEITSVSVERLQDITDEDAKAEGAEKLPDYLLDPKPHRTRRYVEGFCYIWQSINGPDSWEKNPWVWKIEFRRLTP